MHRLFTVNALNCFSATKGFRSPYLSRTPQQCLPQEPQSLAAAVKCSKSMVQVKSHYFRNQRNSVTNATSNSTTQQKASINKRNLSSKRSKTWKVFSTIKLIFAYQKKHHSTTTASQHVTKKESNTYIWIIPKSVHHVLHCCIK